MAIAEIDDDVYIVSRTRLSVKTGGDRASHHVGDAELLERLDNELQ